MDRALRQKAKDKRLFTIDHFDECQPHPHTLWTGSKTMARVEITFF